jgi:hypothetical protein
MARGLVVTLTPAQVVARARYLAGQVDASALDEHVREPALWCPTLVYRLPWPNGGADPTAPHPGMLHEGALRCDCSGGVAWCSGFDRWQRDRMRQAVRAAGYDGWWNTDSKILDVTLPLGDEQACFVDVGRPEPGSILTCKSGSRGHRVGHEAIVIGYRGAEWDPAVRDLWALIDVVDVAARGGRANRASTGRGWAGTGARFVRSVMSAERPAPSVCAAGPER